MEIRPKAIMVWKYGGSRPTLPKISEVSSPGPEIWFFYKQNQWFAMDPTVQHICRVYQDFVLFSCSCSWFWVFALGCGLYCCLWILIQTFPGRGPASLQLQTVEYCLYQKSELASCTCWVMILVTNLVIHKITKIATKFVTKFITQFVCGIWENKRWN